MQYGRKWKETRARFLQRYPLCCVCYQLHGVITPADMVDHIVALDDRSDYQQLHDFDNLAPLCNKHHSHKTRDVDQGDIPADYFKTEIVDKFKRRYEAM
ncbi:HNH endonuclease [Neiella sp. HB171785]|uniref:HNH endonuclease n=1 Tax=Neiella litorisoli TaxID=2771431 RepID=A0A8J6R205_9GAMM|nr:HNH endonuclease [Neiella litorisoli]